MRDDELDALEAELELDPIEEDAAYGGLLDSMSQAFMFDRQLLEARRSRQQAKKAAQTARAQRRRAVQERRAMRAQTATVKSQASQERIVTREQARAEQQRAAQERARTAKEAQRLAQMRIATKQEIQQRKTASEGQKRDTAETRRAVAQTANAHLLTDATADPSRIVTKAGAPVQAAASLTTPPSLPASAPQVGFGAEPRSPAWLGYLLAGGIVAAFAGAFYAESLQPKPTPMRAPRYPRMPLP